MALVRRHWPWALAIPVFVIACILALLPYGPQGRKAKAQQAAPAVGTESPPAEAPLTPEQIQAQLAELSTYQNIQALRRELALTQQDMMALGLNSQSVQGILAFLKSFVSAPGKGGLEEADTAVRQARASLQETNRKINVGPRNETVVASLPTRQQSVATAAMQRDAVMATLIGQVSTILTSEQQELWTAAHNSSVASQEGLGLVAPGPFRYVPNLTDDQVRQLDRIARQNGTKTLLDQGTQLLSAVQQQQLQTIQQNQRVAAAAVAVAENQVLPSPEMFKPKPTAFPTTRPAAIAPR